MFRIDSDGTTTSFPAPEPNGATTGYFQEGNPSLGEQATQVSADWLNAVQEELLNVIEEAGIAPSKTNRAQLLSAIQSLVGVNGGVPIGTIIPFYDYNGALTFDDDVWAYCDGATVTILGVSRVLPDLSNRYLVGFGTEGGGDIDTATWATATVGNASHQINLQHSHTVSSHTHDLANHTHGPGTLQFEVMRSDNVPGSAALYGFTSGGADSQFAGSTQRPTDPGSNALNFTGSFNRTYYTRSGTGTSATPSTNTSSASSPGTDSQLSTTQSIQPRSVRVRFLMRVA